MKFNQPISSIVSVILAWVMSCVFLLLMPENSWADSNPLYKIPANPSAINPNDVGEFAWKTFVALNWPAKCDGSPLENINIGDSPKSPRVWEIYPFPKNIFLKNGQVPTVKKVVPYQCLASTQSELDDISIYLPGDPSHPRSTVLVDRFGNYVINETRMNSAEVEQIVRETWYLATNFDHFNDNSNDPHHPFEPFELVCSSKQGGRYPEDASQNIPCSDNENEGAIELKVAWMVLPDPPDPSKTSSLPDQPKPSPLPDPSKYYTTYRTFEVTNPDQKTKNVTVPVALIGFHIVQKTSKQAWIWSTFEHIHNAPDAPDFKHNQGIGCSKSQKPDPDLNYYNLYNPNFTSQPNELLTNSDSKYFWGNTFPYAVNQNPSQITRQVCITDFHFSNDNNWQTKIKGTVWQNYQLIGVQWIQNPDSYKSQTPAPKLLINTSLEPFQNSKKDFSCISCHKSASLPRSTNRSDFSFLMGKAQFKSQSSP